MLQILHDGIHANLDIDTTNFTGDVETDSQLAYVLGLVGGRLVAVDSSGKVQLADGADANDLRAIGFVINDAAGYFFMNKPAIASLKVPVVFGNAVVITDQIDPAITFAPGEKLYCGTTGKLGLITNVAAAGAALVGYAGSAASAASPELLIYVK